MMLEYYDVNIIGEGLIKEEADVVRAFKHRMSAMTTSSLSLCEMEEIL